jgi:hypothetical protein
VKIFSGVESRDRQPKKKKKLAHAHMLASGDLEISAPKVSSSRAAQCSSPSRSVLRLRLRPAATTAFGV